MMENQAQFHPLKYLQGLVEACKEMGVQLFEQTTAVDLEYNKHPTIVTRNGHRIACRHVISASHYPFYDGQGFILRGCMRNVLMSLPSNHKTHFLAGCILTQNHLLDPFVRHYQRIMRNYG